MIGDVTGEVTAEVVVEDVGGGAMVDVVLEVTCLRVEDVEDDVGVATPGIIVCAGHVELP